MTFARPDLLWLLLSAPLAGLLATWAWQRRLRDTNRWSSRELWRRLLPGYRPRRLAARVLLLGLAVAGTVLGLAGPRWGITEEVVEQRGADVVFVIDSSLSMSATDVAPDRLSVAKALVRRLLERLPGDRIGLVQAEGDGQVMAPLTLDRAVIDLLLDSLQPASLPTPGTRLATGLEKALELLPPESSSSTAVVLVSDGEDHGEDHEAIGRALARSGVTVHTIAVGTREGGPLPLPGGSRGYKRDRAGEVVVSRLEPGWLAELTRATGGVHVEASGGGQGLEPVLAALRGATERTTGTEVLRQPTERFPWFLGASLGAILLLMATPPFARDEEGP